MLITHLETVTHLWGFLMILFALLLPLSLLTPITSNLSHKHSSETCLSKLLLLYFVLAPHLQEQEALSYLSAINCNHCCFMTSQRSSSSRLSHCFLLCGRARWSPSFPTIQLTEVLAQMNFPACNGVRQWLNHVSQVLTFNGTWIIFEQCILLPLAYCGQLGTCFPA